MMKNKMRVAAIVSSGVLLALGSTMLTGASGWEQEHGHWIYRDSYGDKVYETWKKSGNYYYYLDEDGIMATNRLIDNGEETYYVDEQGIRVANRWICVDNEDGEEVNGQEVDVLWYYFGSNGKAYRATTTDLRAREIGGATYVFDQNGRMASGWAQIGEKTYYLGSEHEGWARSGWQYLEPAEYMVSEYYDEEEWFFFKDSGEMRYSCSAYIDGIYYRFNTDGVMEDEWHSPNTSAEAFAAENGAVTNGWVYTTEPGDPDGDYYWYYLISVKGEDGKTVRGVPFNYESGKGYQAKHINNKTYIFDDDGKMLDGIIELEHDLKEEVSGAKPLEAGIYYFDEREGSTNGQMRTGKVTLDVDGEIYDYYFQSSGKAYVNTVKNGVLYDEDGLRVDAEDGNTYMVYRTRDNIKVDGSSKVIPEGTRILVNASGRVKTSGTVKIDGETWKVVNTDTYEVAPQ